ncbi:hypothetical protein [Nostoc parmelioides]|uniref:Uncharacterized protein n=1 Tax=Nostoc parmelioides FACHB-3921 TaxID=2692909 RepID=A0ABR8BLG2_9NOSO|nr:hypothetical protein [Nostoc parmelioides]MBD2254047.1 hypothetical protein [Nostoc parmelioides FACHB-3921]
MLPNTRPVDDPVSLWNMQQYLLTEAEQLLGSRDPTKIIYRPTFHPNGPFLRNTPNLDGAFAQMSFNARDYWPTVVYELAHETVHLLNPTVGHTNWFEEGVAVEFSIYAQSLFKLPSYQPQTGAYLEALQLVRSLPNNPFISAKKIRAKIGALNTLNISRIQDTFPKICPSLAKKLCEQFLP